MATKTFKVHYPSVEDANYRKLCPCVGAQHIAVLKNGAVRADRNHAVLDLVIDSIENGDLGGYDVTFSYDDATPPLSGGVPIVPRVDVPGCVSGNICPPECFEECSPAQTVMALVQKWYWDND